MLALVFQADFSDDDTILKRIVTSLIKHDAIANKAVLARAYHEMKPTVRMFFDEVVDDEGKYILRSRKEASVPEPEELAAV